MFARFIMLMLVAILAAPVATLPGSGHPERAPWGEVARAAKGKKHTAKKKRPKRPSTTVSRAVRGPITQTFLNTGAITIPGGAPGTTKGSADPHPATIAVGGFTNAVITDVDLVLLDVSHAVPEDIDILLVKDDGRRALVMSDVGRIVRVTNADLTLDDEASAPLPGIDLASGTFRPTDISVPGQPPDEFASPAPAPDGRIALSTFDGANPNGTWQLFVADDASGDTGSISGWALRITAEVDLATVDQVVPGDHNAKHRQRNAKRGGQGKKGRK